MGWIDGGEAVAVGVGPGSVSEGLDVVEPDSLDAAFEA